MSEGTRDMSKASPDHEVDHFFASFEAEISACVINERTADLRSIVAAGLHRMYLVGYTKALKDVASLSNKDISDTDIQGVDNG